MTCAEYVERVSDYLDDELTPPERAACDQHAASCPGCTRYLAQLRATARLLRLLGEIVRG